MTEIKLPSYFVRNPDGTITIDETKVADYSREEMMGICCECGEEAELRPYGPGGVGICNPCGTSPEHVERSKAVFYDLVSGRLR